MQGSATLAVDGDFHEEADGSKIIAAGDNVEIYAGKALVLACGNSHIELTEDGKILIVPKSIELKADRADIN